MVAHGSDAFHRFSQTSSSRVRSLENCSPPLDKTLSEAQGKKALRRGLAAPRLPAPLCTRAQMLDAESPCTPHRSSRVVFSGPAQEWLGGRASASHRLLEFET